MPPRLAPPTTLSPPPSPKHHTRRKSAQPHTTKSHAHKPSRPILPSRRTTSTKTASSKASASACPSSPPASFPSEIESFFNFCTTCDKQLPGSSDLSLYCSSSCRLSDLPSSNASGNGGYAFPASPPLTPFAMTFPVLHERKRSAERDILPRMSPSYYDSESWYELPRGERATPALESLRSLSRALEATSSYRPALAVETYAADTYNTYALPRRPSFSSEEEEEDEDSEEDSDDEEEYQRLHRRVPSTPHPGAAIYGTYLKPASSMETYTNNVQLPGKGSPETWRARGRDLVTPVMG